MHPNGPHGEQTLRRQNKAKTQLLRNIKQFWPLYALYAVELCIFLLFCAVVLAAYFSVEELFFLDAALYAELKDIAVLYHVILAFPVIIGFPFRLYFIKGLWIAYAWTSFFWARDALPIFDGYWIELFTDLLHPGIVTGILIFSSAGRNFFAPKKIDAEEGALAEFPEHDALSAESFLVMRIRKRQPKRAAILEYEQGLFQGYWVGAVMMIWGYFMNLRIVGLMGLCFLFACFLFHRRIVGSKGVFFERIPLPAGKCGQAAGSGPVSQPFDTIERVRKGRAIGVECEPVKVAGGEPAMARLRIATVGLIAETPVRSPEYIHAQAAVRGFNGSENFVLVSHCYSNPALT